MNDFENRQYMLILKKINLFENGIIDISELINSLEELNALLEEADFKWAETFRNISNNLEEIYAIALYENKICFDEEDINSLESVLERLKKITNDKLRTSLKCKICGLIQLDFPWGANGDNPSYETCDCCGCIFGLDDTTFEMIKKHRENWLDQGAKWSNEEKMPLGWSMEEQLKNLN